MGAVFDAGGGDLVLPDSCLCLMARRLVGDGVAAHLHAADGTVDHLVVGAVLDAGGSLDILRYGTAVRVLADVAADGAGAVLPCVAANGAAAPALTGSADPIVAQCIVGDGITAHLRVADGAVDHFIVGTVPDAGSGDLVFHHRRAADVGRALRILPHQHGIAAVDTAQIPLEAAAQRGGHGPGRQFVGGLGGGAGGAGVVTANARFGSALQIVDVGERIRPAYRRAHGIAAGLCHGDRAGAVAVGKAGAFHNAHQTARHVLRGGDGAGVVHILDDGLLGIAHHAAHIRAAALDVAGVVAAGHGACVKLIAQAAQILHTGHIALVAAVDHGAVHQHTGQTAHADLGIHRHVNTGDHAGDIRVFAVAHNTGHVARTNGELAAGVHAALDRQILDDGVRIAGALHIAEQAQIHTLTGGGRLIVDVQVPDHMACAVEAAGKACAGTADRRPVDIVQVHVRRQHGGEGGIAAVDLLDEPHQLIGGAQLVRAVLLRRHNGGLHGDGAFRLHLAAGGGDGGRTGLQTGDGAVIHSGHLVVGGGPDDGLVGGVLRHYCGSQLGGVALVQGQHRFVQRHLAGRNGRQYRDGTFRLHTAAGGGNGGGALALGGDNAVLHGGDRVIGGRPHHRIGGIRRRGRGGQSRLFGGMQGQLRLVQLYAGSGDCFHRSLDEQIVGRARHDVHNGQIGDLAVGLRRELHQLGDLCVFQRHAIQLRGGHRKGIGTFFVHVAGVCVAYHQEGSVLDINGHGIAAVHRDFIGIAVGVRAVHLLDPIGLVAHLHADGACGGRRYRDGAFCPRAAADGGDGGRTGRHGGDGAVVHGGHRIIGGGPRQLVGGVFRCGRGGQGGGAALGQGQRRLAQRHAFSGNAVLLKPHRHIVIGEVGGLGETVTVVAGAGDIERHLIDLAQTGQIPFRPVHHDVVRAIAQIEEGLAGLRAAGIVAGGHQLHPVVVADLGGQAVAVNIAVQGVGGVGDIHVVDDPLRAVGKRQGGQCVLTKAVAGIVGVTKVYGKVIGAVVSAAHAADGGIRAGLVYREL